MAVTVQSILEVARSLKDLNNEAGWRSCISRAYYAAFLHADAWHDALPSKGARPDRSGGRHHDLASGLIAPTLPVDDSRRKASVSSGYILRDAHKLRVKADYLIHEHVSEADASQIIASAQKIIESLT